MKTTTKTMTAMFPIKAPSCDWRIIPVTSEQVFDCIVCNSGTGDLFAAVICASLVNGLTVEEAAKKATFFLKPAIEDAVAEHVESNHGVDFEKYLSRANKYSTALSAKLFLRYLRCVQDSRRLWRRR